MRTPLYRERIHKAPAIVSYMIQSSLSDECVFRASWLTGQFRRSEEPNGLTSSTDELEIWGYDSNVHLERHKRMCVSFQYSLLITKAVHDAWFLLMHSSVPR